MLKHLTYRDKVIPSGFGDIVIDGEGNITSDFSKEEQKFLLTIPGYYCEGHEEEAEEANDLASVEEQLLKSLPKEIVEHLPQNSDKKGAVEEVIEGKDETPDFSEVKDYEDITVADIEKELEAEKVEFDKKSNKKEKYALYVEAKKK